MAKGISHTNIPDEKREEIKELLSKVRVSEICARVGVKPHVVYNVLSGKSSTLAAYTDLQKVVDEAKKDYAAKLNVINSLSAAV